MDKIIKFLKNIWDKIVKAIKNKWGTRCIILAVLLLIWSGKYCYDDPLGYEIDRVENLYIDVIIPFVNYFLLFFLLGTLVYLVYRVSFEFLSYALNKKGNLENKRKELKKEAELKQGAFNNEALASVDTDAKKAVKEEFEEKIKGAYHGVTRFIFFLIAAIIFLQAGIDATLVILGELDMSKGLIKITLEAITALNVIGLHVGIEPFMMGKPFKEVVEAIRENMLLYILLGGNVILEIVIILLTRDIWAKTNFF